MDILGIIEAGATIPAIAWLVWRLRAIERTTEHRRIKFDKRMARHGRALRVLLLTAKGEKMNGEIDEVLRDGEL